MIIHIHILNIKFSSVIIKTEKSFSRSIYIILKSIFLLGKIEKNVLSQKHNMTHFSWPRHMLVLGSFESAIINEQHGKRYQNTSF